MTSSRMRGACLTAVLLCALGVLCAAVVRPAEANGHHRHGAVITAAVADTQTAAATRAAQAAVTGEAPQTAGLRLVSVVALQSGGAADQFDTGTARQRGPPALVA